MHHFFRVVYIQTKQVIGACDITAPVRWLVGSSVYDMCFLFISLAGLVLFKAVVCICLFVCCFSFTPVLLSTQFLTLLHASHEICSQQDTIQA